MNGTMNTRKTAKSVKSAAERALDYVSKSSRIRLQDLRDNPGATVKGREVTKAHNQAGHTIGELQSAAKPPSGWVWGDWFKPWQRTFPGEQSFNGDINLRREYVPLSLLELQRMIDLGWLDTTRLIDICQIANTQLIKIHPELRQFGIHLTDEGSDMFAAKLNIEVQRADLTTIAAIERAGGRIRTAYYDLESLKVAVDAEKWFLAGRPIPRRKFPPHSLSTFYTNPNYRGYLADNDSIVKSQLRLAEILQYSLPKVSAEDEGRWKTEQKDPNSVFLGIESGSVVSLPDRKVLEPTNPILVDHYRSSSPLADHLR